ncbi:serine/threonine protein kinase [Streptomyces cocklensis]|uniref:non-specific serine/threonine protein kinase n=1 Tax=Actinacidiphila cocklensis TaxID=887465 RepID=A0A9W4DS86_9ACTN|nr:serine/threonine-protein kinase [Actinacidiphila cocklensis]MDD1058378.1 serine/threonine protein kinase [Actinacidiphila cocklensis]CAG6396762.1 Non-specific serine/threonine protein kinase [Actinacidiphila cocklensis]
MAGYRLRARIGEGGMGSVYLSHTRGGQPLALKVIRREYAQDEEFRRRFQQEVQAARRVQGYYVVPVLDHDTTGNQPWLATAYVPGLPLDEALARYGALPLPSVLQLMGCAAEALRAVHAAGVIHRDLKPSNILLGAAGPSVIDFGIARAADSTALTRSGGLIGTPQFMSPEHANGLTLTPATDVFSLGLIAAVAATGRHPYGEAGAITLAAQIANTAIRPPDLSPYPEPLRGLLERCLTADPDARPSPQELAESCAAAAGRALRDVAGWLPEPVAAEIVRREAAAKLPPEPESAPSAVPPAAPPAMPPAMPPRPVVPPAPAAGSVPVTMPEVAPTGAFGAPAPQQAGPQTPGPQATTPLTSAYPAGPPTSWQPPGGPQQPAPAPSAGRPGGRMRKVLLIGGGVLVLVLAVTLTYTFTRNSGGDDAAAKNPASSNPTTPVSPTPTPQQPTATDPSGSGTPSSDTGGAASGDYQVIFQDHPLTVRPPNSLDSGPDVDLDQPKVDPQHSLEGGEVEFSYSDDYLSFDTPAGKSPTADPADCKASAESTPLPTQVDAKDLVGTNAELKVGDRLCTVTTSGNLAMWTITQTEPSQNFYKTPVFIGTLTLWKIPGSTS